MANIAVHATSAGIRHVRAGHPWLFEDSIASVSRAGEPGELAVVFDKDRKFVGIGLYDPDSPIRVKMVHHGASRAIDAGFWRERIDQALARRATLIADPATTGYRLIHGENDRLPGLIVDRYGAVAVVKLYSRAWFPHLDAVVGELQAALPAETVVVRLSRQTRRAADAQPARSPGDGVALLGPLPTAPVLFLEHGLTLEADVVHGQKTGYFLDQRDNRQRVRHHSTGAEVLDLFSCSGGFSLAAAAGGATAVESVDLAAEALATARRNFTHNAHEPAVATCHHTTTVGDAFEVLERLNTRRARFDVVIIDPPSFAPRAANTDSARRAYGRLTRLGVTLVRPGGLLVQSSCSSRVTAEQFFATVTDHANVAGVELEELERTGHAEDHPVGFAEGAYLKTLFARRRAVSGAGRAWR